MTQSRADLPTYERGDYVKVEFPGEAGMPSEWMWVRVNRCDDQKKLVFGTLDNERLSMSTQARSNSVRNSPSLIPRFGITRNRTVVGDP